MCDPSDYVKHRVAKGLPPLAFRLSAVQAISNPTLNAQFEAERKRLQSLGRTAEEVKAKWGVHGTRRTNIVKIASAGLLRVGHPQNPSHSTDAGWFGSPKHGVYLSRDSDYCLK